MYEKLVSNLRERAAWINFPHHGEEYQSEDSKLMTEAADAIEELQKDVNFHKFNSEFWEDKYNSLADEKWIPVTERLPEHEYGESTSVLTVDLYGVMRVTYFDGGNWCFPTGEALTTMRVAPITHWMPLPEPPKMDEGDTNG